MVKFWKIFAATAVIFISGYVAGYSVRGNRDVESSYPVDRTRPPWERQSGEQRGPRPERNESGPGRENRFTQSLIDRIDHRLGLSEEERESIRLALDGHRKAMRDIWGDRIRPIIDEEMERVQEATLELLGSDEKRQAYLEFVEESRRFEHNRGPRNGPSRFEPGKEEGPRGSRWNGDPNRPERPGGRPARPDGEGEAAPKPRSDVD